MHIGKTLFAQVMDFLPWKTFHRIVTPLPWQPPRANADLCRAVSLHGLRSAHLPGKSPRHRGLSLGASSQALPHGLSPTGEPLHAGGCQRTAQLAHLRRLCPATDYPGPKTLCSRLVWRGPVEHSLHSRCHHHRPVPVDVTLGAVSLHQGGDQAAHLARSARGNSELYSHHPTASYTMSTFSIC